MPAYVPNATQTTEPVESRTVESAALEFRTLKSSINSRIADLEAKDDLLDAEDAALQAEIDAVEVRTLALEQLAFNGATPGTVVVQRFVTDAIETAFTLGVTPVTVAAVDAYINGVYQNHDTFSVSGNVVTFSESPAAGILELQVSVPLQLGVTTADAVEYIPAGTGAVTTTVQSKLRETVSVKDFGADPTGATDSSQAVQKAYAALKAVGGGVLSFPYGTYKFYLDVSGSTSFITFEGNGSTFKPASDRAFSAILKCDNSGAAGEFSHTYTRWINCTFDASNTTDYGVYLKGSCADFEYCTFISARIAGVYGTYAQYCRFEHCTFGANVFSNATYGCYLTGWDGAHRSNEVWFQRCQFFTNKNGLYVGGGEKVRIHDCTFQDHQAGGTAALYIHTDLGGYSARYTDVTGCWFEINQSKALLLGIAEGTNIERNAFFGNPTYTCVVQSDTSYDLRFIDNSALSYATITFNHPSGNTDAASVTVRGNNQWPTLNLAHNGPSYVNGESAATNTRRNDSMLLTSGQFDQNSAPIVGVENWFGAKKAVAKATSTQLFSITQQTFNTLAYRVVCLTVELYTWDDTNAASQFGYSGHAQRYTVFISNNNTGAPQVSIVQESAGTDVGISTAWQAPGSITLSSSVSGDTITFSASWPGSGTGASGMTLQTVAYMVRGAGTNNFYMTRL